MTTLERCPGCGANFPATQGPIHRYMTSSPGCWAAYGQLLAAEYSDPVLLATHRLSVDTYAVQHPGDTSRQAIQSVGLHLARLFVQLSSKPKPKETNDVMLNLSKGKASLKHLSPPPRFTMTLLDVAPLIDSPQHPSAVRAWARATWNDWALHHDYIREWVAHQWA